MEQKRVDPTFDERQINTDWAIQHLKKQGEWRSSSYKASEVKAYWDQLFKSDKPAEGSKEEKNKVNGPSLHSNTEIGSHCGHTSQSSVAPHRMLRKKVCSVFLL